MYGKFLLLASQSDSLLGDLVFLTKLSFKLKLNFQMSFILNLSLKFSFRGNVWFKLSIIRKIK